MLIKLHSNATTTPRQRAYIQQSSSSVAELARELGVNEATVRRWKARPDTVDRPSTPHRIITSFSAEEEVIALDLRRSLGLSLDDALEVLHRCLRPDLSRAALYRLWRRHGIAARPRPDQAPHSGTFAPEPFGYIHVDLKHLTRLEGRPAYAFVVIERTTRFVHVEILPDRSAHTVAHAFERFLATFAHPVHTVLTDNGAEFTDRFGGAFYISRKTGTGRHPFDRICRHNAIQHKLTKPYHPQTNGMVERFNRRLGEALAAKHPNGKNAGKNRFASHQERNSFIANFVHNYNRTRLRCLQYQAPNQCLHNLTKHNTKAGVLGPSGFSSRDCPDY
jgi:transposase InsO family protein